MALDPQWLAERANIARLGLAMRSLNNSPLPAGITRILREEFSAAINVSALGPAKFVLDAAEEVIELSGKERAG